MFPGSAFKLVPNVINRRHNKGEIPGIFPGVKWEVGRNDYAREAKLQLNNTISRRDSEAQVTAIEMSQPLVLGKPSRHEMQLSISENDTVRSRELCGRKGRRVQSLYLRTLQILYTVHFDSDLALLWLEYFLQPMKYTVFSFVGKYFDERAVRATLYEYE